MRSFIFPALIIAGLALGFVMIKQFLVSLAPYTWTATQCLVEQSQIIYNEESGVCTHQLAFKYQVDGQSFSGNTWRLDPGEPSTWCSSLASIAGETPSNQPTTCYVDPQNPQQAVIDQGSLLSLLGLLFPLLLIIIGIVGFRSQQSTSPFINPTRVKTICKFVASTAFFVATTGGIYMGVGPIVEVIQAADWQTAECTILSSSLKTSNSSQQNQRRGYEIAIVYSYRIGDISYINDRFDFIKWGSGSADSLAEITNQYPVGEKVSCYVDPQNNYESVIDRDYGIRYLAGFMPFIFSFGSLILLLAAKKWM